MIAATQAFATVATDSLIKIPCLEVFVSAGLSEITIGTSENAVSILHAVVVWLHMLMQTSTFSS